MRGWKRNPNWLRDGLSGIGGLSFGCAFAVGALRLGYAIPGWILIASILLSMTLFESLLPRCPLWLVVAVAGISVALLVVAQSMPQQVRM